MKLQRWITTVLIVLAAGAAVVPGTGDVAAGPVLQAILPVTSRFGADAEGWTTTVDAEGNPTPNWSNVGGNPGGQIFARDGLESVKWYWKAPDLFLGDMSAAYGRALTFDLKQESIVNPTNDIDVVLSGAGMTLVFDTPFNPGTTWTRYHVPLTATGGWKKQSLTGPAPTQAEMEAVLASLTELRIRGDYIVGQSVCNLDNVVLGADIDPNQPLLPLKLYLPFIAR